MRLIRWKEVQRLTGVTRRTAERWAAKGEFPPARVKEGLSFWVESEILEWVQVMVKSAA